MVMGTIQREEREMFLIIGKTEKTKVGVKSLRISVESESTQ